MSYISRSAVENSCVVYVIVQINLFRCEMDRQHIDSKKKCIVVLDQLKGENVLDSQNKIEARLFEVGDRM